MELTPDERQRIYLEEKTRLEAQDRLRHEAEETRQNITRAEGERKKDRKRGYLAIFAILGVVILILMMFGKNDTPSTKATGSQTPSKPSCDTAKATELISKLKEERIIYRIDAPSDLYPRVYVTEVWHALPMDQKKVVDRVLYCWGSHGGAKDIIVKYYDYRTEKKIALGGAAGFSLQ